MSRQASPKTAFIRKLLDESNGEITHADARPLLRKEGFDIAKEGGEDFEKESNYYNVTKYNWSKLQKSRKGGGRPPQTKNTKARTAAKSKRPKHRRHPEPTKVTTHKRREPVKAHKKSRRIPANSVYLPQEALEALALVEKLGGISGAEGRIAEIQQAAEKEIASIRAAVDLVVTVKNQFDRAAA